MCIRDRYMFGYLCLLDSCWLCAGLVSKINSCCCCTLPAVVSHLPKCDAECLQHLPLHSATCGAATSRVQRGDHSNMKQTNSVARSKRPAARTTAAHHSGCRDPGQQPKKQFQQLQGRVQSNAQLCSVWCAPSVRSGRRGGRSIFPRRVQAGGRAPKAPTQAVDDLLCDVLLGLPLGQSSWCVNPVPTTAAAPNVLACPVTTSCSICHHLPNSTSNSKVRR